ncbi:class I SAM-dependent methyltransferase [Paludibaculum fermentans]|uniref:class I SAM-dependent methyltransferase n=1 Tax=Paludibaculum fermentans TaxID=1473598 RepID=UPI003EC06F4E
MEIHSLSRKKVFWSKVGISFAALLVFFALRPDAPLDVLDTIHAQYQMRIVSPSLIRNYVASHSARKLQIGAGTNNLAGWLNTDIEPTADQAYLDASVPFPLPDSSFRYVFSEHVVEHIPYEKADVLFKECYRVLAPGGRIRIATPDLTRFIGLFAEHPSAEVADYIKRKEARHRWPNTPDPAAYILNMQMRSWGHQFVYSPAMLRAALARAKFEEITEYKAGQGDDPALAGVEARPHSVYREMNEYETMVFEAVRR